MKATEFLQHLNAVQLFEPEQWKACCPAHSDHHPSLIVKETDDRLLIHCRAGCPTTDILAAVGLDYSDLFLDSGISNGATHRSGPRQPELVPRWYWNWRKQCAEIERLTQEKREHAEAVLSGSQGLNIDVLTINEFDEVMKLVSHAYAWLARCDRLDETLYLLQQTLRKEERQKGKVLLCKPSA